MTDIYDSLSQLQHIPTFAPQCDAFTIEESIDGARHAAWCEFAALTGMYPMFDKGRWTYNVGSGAKSIIPPKYTGVRLTRDVLYSLCKQIEMPADVIARMFDELQEHEQQCDAAKRQLTCADFRASRPLRYDDYASPEEYYAAKAERDDEGPSEREREAVEAFDDRREPMQKKQYTPPPRTSVFGGPPRVPPQSPYASPDMPPCVPLEGVPDHPATPDERRKFNEKLAKQVVKEDAEKARRALYAATDERKTNGIKYARGFQTDAAWLVLPLACYRLPPSVFASPKYNAPWTQCEQCAQ